MRPTLNRSLLNLALLFLFLLACLLAALLLTRGHDYHQSDFGYYWIGSRMMLEGQDPYDPAQWVPFAQSYNASTESVISFAYPMPMILLFMPLAALDLGPAAVIWVALMGLMVGSSVILLLRRFERRRSIAIYLPLIAGMLLFRPVVTTFYHGQMTGLIFFTLVLSAALIDRGKWKSGAAVLALLIIKPQVGLPLMGLAGLWFIMRRRWQALMAEVLASLLFLAPSFLYQPDWVGRWLSSGGNSLQVVFYQSATLWGLSTLVCRGSQACAFPLAIGLVLVVIAVGFLLLVRFRDQDAFLLFGLMVCIVLLSTPYLLINDQIYLLLPVLSVARKLDRLNFPYIATATSTIWLGLLSFGLVPLVLRLASDAPSSLVTLFAGGVTIFALFQSKAIERKPRIYGLQRPAT